MLVDSKLGMSQQRARAAQKAKSLLSCTNRRMAKKSKGSDYIPLLSTCETVSRVQCAILGPPINQRDWLIGASSAESRQCGQELEHLPCEGTLKELGLFRLEKRWL